jgi:hypothetical protein
MSISSEASWDEVKKGIDAAVGLAKNTGVGWSVDAGFEVTDVFSTSRTSVNCQIIGGSAAEAAPGADYEKFFYSLMQGENINLHNAVPRVYKLNYLADNKSVPVVSLRSTEEMGADALEVELEILSVGSEDEFILYVDDVGADYTFGTDEATDKNMYFNYKEPSAKDSKTKFTVQNMGEYPAVIIRFTQNYDTLFGHEEKSGAVFLPINDPNYDYSIPISGPKKRFVYETPGDDMFNSSASRTFYIEALATPLANVTEPEPAPEAETATEAEEEAPSRLTPVQAAEEYEKYMARNANHLTDAARELLDERTGGDTSMEMAYLEESGSFGGSERFRRFVLAWLVNANAEASPGILKDDFEGNPVKVRFNAALRYVVKSPELKAIMLELTRQHLKGDEYLNLYKYLDGFASDEELSTVEGWAALAMAEELCAKVSAAF